MIKIEIPGAVRRRLLASALVVAAVAAPLSGTRAQSTGDASGLTARMNAVDARTGAAPLLERARLQGRLRVIVGLSDGSLTEPNLDVAPPAVAARRSRIGVLQQAVLADLGARRGPTGRLAGPAMADITMFETIPFMALELDADTLRRLAADPRVATVQEDVAVPPTLTQSVPLVRADQAAVLGFSGTGRAVAVLDTGVAKDHPMLAGKVVSEACYSSTVPGQSTSLCPGGAQQSTAINSGRNCSASIPGCDHGTHVASIAAGNAASLKGVARGANVVAIQVFSNFGGSLSAYFSDVVEGLERVYALRTTFSIASANLSLGGGLYSSNCNSLQPAMTAIIKNLRAAKVATAIASGNDFADGQVSAPGCISAAVTVGSTTKSDQVSSFSNHAGLVDLMAPGSSIFAALPPSSFGTLSGTSMATPHVAGAFAVLRQAKPSATVGELQSALACTGIPVSRGSLAKRRIDVLAALNVVRSPATGCL